MLYSLAGHHPGHARLHRQGRHRGGRAERARPRRALHHPRRAAAPPTARSSWSAAATPPSRRAGRRPRTTRSRPRWRRWPPRPPAALRASRAARRCGCATTTSLFTGPATAPGWTDQLHHDRQRDPDQLARGRPGAADRRRRSRRTRTIPATSGRGRSTPAADAATAFAASPARPGHPGTGRRSRQAGRRRAPPPSPVSARRYAVRHRGLDAPGEQQRDRRGPGPPGGAGHRPARPRSAARRRRSPPRCRTARRHQRHPPGGRQRPVPAWTRSAPATLAGLVRRGRRRPPGRAAGGHHRHAGGRLLRHAGRRARACSAGSSARRRWGWSRPRPATSTTVVSLTGIVTDRHRPAAGLRLHGGPAAGRPAGARGRGDRPDGHGAGRLRLPLTAGCPSPARRVHCRPPSTYRGGVSSGQMIDWDVAISTGVRWADRGRRSACLRRGRWSRSCVSWPVTVAEPVQRGDRDDQRRGRRAGSPWWTGPGGSGRTWTGSGWSSTRWPSTCVSTAGHPTPGSVIGIGRVTGHRDAGRADPRLPGRPGARPVRAVPAARPGRARRRGTGGPAHPGRAQHRHGRARTRCRPARLPALGVPARGDPPDPVHLGAPGCAATCRSR